MGCCLRALGHIPAAEYRKVIVGLIFLRYMSSAFEKRYQELVAEGDGFEDDRDAYAEENIFFVPENDRWGKIASAAHTSEIGTSLLDAIHNNCVESAKLVNLRNIILPRLMSGEIDVSDIDF